MFSPIIKWSGSKRSQAETISRIINSVTYNKYYEPFIGGGSILRAVHPNKGICGDICKPLIDLWNVIKDNPREAKLGYRIRWNLLQQNGVDEYYKVRDRFNIYKDPIDFLFLTRTCMNGLIRFNSKNEFNVSFHLNRDGINPNKLDKIIDEWNHSITNINFICQDFEDTLVSALNDDIVYLDPPYYNTKGMYNNDFSYLRLLSCLEDLNKRGVRWVLSYDGISGEENNIIDIPKNMYKHMELLPSGVSSFKRIVNKGRAFVYESLYTNFEYRT